MLQIFYFIMTITKDRKKEIINSLAKDLSSQKSTVFIGFKGLKGGDALLVRRELSKVGARMLVVRKTLAKIAFEKEKIDFDPLSLEGEVGFVFGFEEGIDMTKSIHSFAKNEKVSILGGIFEGRVISSEEVAELALLPSREELLAKLLSTMSAPVGGFLQVLQGNIKGLLVVLSKAKS